MHHPPAHVRRLRDGALEQLLGREAAVAGVVAVDHQSHAHQIRGDGDHPEPRVAQHHDQRVAGVASLHALDLAVVREKRDLLQRRDVALLADAIADDGAVAAGVHHEPRLDHLALGGLDHGAQGVLEHDRGDRGLLAHVHAARRRVAQ